MSSGVDQKLVKNRIAEWTTAPYDAATRDEIKSLSDAGKNDELEDRFYRTLEFGTGGLRGKLGAGTNRMNSYVVARATQGLANYVIANATKPGPLRAAIAHDSRHRSREFAETAAAVFAANGSLAHISPALRPTPYLSFAVRKLDCHTGIVVTASHNPKEYNGYKVYWDDGSQVIPPHDEGIIVEVNKVTSDADVKRIDYEEGIAKGLIKVMGAEMDTDYLNAILEQRYDEKIIRANQPRIVYTPLHGVGGTLAPRALKMWGFDDVLPEPEQMQPNGDFPTAASPNPEEGAALDRAIQLAKRENAELVLATDPDADRLGIAVKNNDAFELMTGNQVSSLLADFILRNQQKRSPGVKLGMATTVVTSPLVKKVADGLNAECPLVLTGFKWIANVIRQWVAKPNSPRFVYGTEESYGYLIGNHARDKDGIVAACCVAEMAAHAKSEGRNLIDELYEIFRKYGVHFEWTKSVTLPGISGAQRIQEILNAIRKNPPQNIAGRDVTKFTRLDTGDVFENGKKTGSVDLPPSDVFLFDLKDGSRVIVRPSGTEPKIKFYFFLCDARSGMSAEAAKKSYKDLEGTSREFEKQFLGLIGL